MGNMSRQLHVLFFPFMAHGHMIPILDMAKLFASRGVKSTILTTPLNAISFEKAIERTKDLGFQISLQIIKFPSMEAGLPEGCENADQLTSDDLVPIFFNATTMLKQPLEHILQESRPDCLVSDMFFPWTTEVAAKFNIHRLVFHGTSSFALCAGHSMRVYKPFKNVSSDSEPFVLPNLPHEIKLIRTQLAPSEREEPDPETLTGFAKLFIAVREADVSSYGVIFNSFYDLEPDYADHYRKILNKKIWHVGPVSLCNRNFEDKSERGKKSTIDQQECLKWLDSKKPNSVIYVCFGSVTNFSSSQLYEIAMALEASGQNFIWVIRKVKDDEEWLPEGFEERVKGKGLIIKGWAPQVLILDHEATGGFMTHCGWNSTLEGVSAGVPMVTWPFFADQFYNEKLVGEVLRTGVPVGVKEWSRNSSGGIKREAIEKAVKSLMVGEESLEMRKRAKELKEMARKAVEEGGSSYESLSDLIQELTSYGS